jgi:hypothetical protein
MKKWLYVLLGLIVVSAFVGCSKPRAKETVEEVESSPVAEEVSAPIDVATEAEVSNQNVEIITVTPEGWSPVEGSLIPVQYGKNTASYMIKEEGFRGATLDEVVEEAFTAYKNAFDNVQLVGEVEPITIDGIEARKLTFTCEMSQMEMKFLFVYLFVEGKVYAITFGDLAETFDELSADYETILGQIEFD